MVKFASSRNLRATFFLLLFFFTACTAKTPSPPPISRPEILSVSANRAEVPRYELLELTLNVQVEAESYLDSRQAALDAVFSDPNGREWKAPGFWESGAVWKVRFTPSVEGEWQYRATMRTKDTESKAATGRFSVIPSKHHGWLQVGSWVMADYSPRYLVYHDGTPFYGLGHCDAFTVMSYGYDEQKGFALFDRMAAHGENLLVYWPIFSNPFFNQSPDHYSTPDLKLIDLVVEDAAKKGIFLAFTIWDHPELRDKTHPWGDGLWETQNGFRTLGPVSNFFTDGEMWAWQENLYRYLIARWGYSPAIGMWQIVSEIEGTNAGLYRDDWHEKVNAYFVTHDPYRHPTTASMAGDQWWPQGYAVTDLPQVHSYAGGDEPIGIGPRIAGWTQKMWKAQNKPNWVGEFGSSDENNYPELFHNALWAALASGAALTPMEWNDGNQWSTMSEEMLRHMKILGQVVSDLPLALLNPQPLALSVSGKEGKLMGWGLALTPLPELGEQSRVRAFFWIQHVSALGKPIKAVRQNVVSLSGVTVQIKNFPAGRYLVRTFDTWQGKYLPEFEATAAEDTLTITLPAFERDIAVKIEQR